ncbi:MAG: hypothetical protein SynsKO_22300 [Synoicihabitans sp.]
MNSQAIISFVKKHPIGVGCTVLAIVLAVLTFVRAGALEELEVLVQERSDMGSRLKNNLRYSADLDTDLETVIAAVESVEAKVINPGALATNLQFFYRLEQELGLTIIDLKQEVVEKPKQPREYQPVPYSVAVQGTYVQLVDFLQNLEQGDRIVRYESVSFAPARGLAAQQADPYDPVIVLTLELELLGRS